MTVRCGHKTHDTAVASIHHHEDVAMVRRCFGLEHGLYSLEEQASIEAQDEPQTCSICDGIGHGYPGAGPCPTEINEVQYWETDAEERMAAQADFAMHEMQMADYDNEDLADYI